MSTSATPRRPPTVLLNPELVARQKLGADEISLLEASHAEKEDLFHRMRAAEGRELLELAREFDQLEFRQQGIWGFPRDPRHHFWFRVPHCACCDMSNTMLYGVSDWRMVNPRCPVHGQVLVADGGHGPEDVVLDPSAYAGTAWRWVPIAPRSVHRREGHRLIDTREGIQGRALLEFLPPGELAS